MSTVKKIQEYIEAMPYGEPFSAKSLQHLGSTENVRKILGRMALSGEIRRVARGIFCKPKAVSTLGEIMPSAKEVAAYAAHTNGEEIAIHGAEAARRLHLSTQVPAQLIYYTTGNTRHIRFGNRTILLKHISPRKLVAPGTTAGTIISALWYLGKGNVNKETIFVIRQQITDEEFQEVLQKVEYMPGWMANTFFSFCTQQQESYE